MTLPARLLKCIQVNKLIQSGDKIIVAVSGGADSMSLLYALHHLRSELGLSLVVAHFDHNLRKLSAQDCVFVKTAASNLNLPFISKLNNKLMPKTGSIEEFAREQRYQFLFSVVKKFHADALVTAHTLDDLSETVLMRLLRGTGLGGLQAILPRRMIKGVQLIRPMLSFYRYEVEEYLKEIKVGFVTDPTNASFDFTRNKVRNLLIPLMEKEFNVGVKSNLARLANISAIDYEYIELQAGKFFAKWANISAHSVVIPLKSLKRTHCSIRRIVFRMAYAELAGSIKPLTMAHIEGVDAMVLHAQRGGKICLPGNILSSILRSNLVLGKL